MNELLERQIQDHLGAGSQLQERLAALFDVVSRTYDQYEKEIKEMENSMNASSSEMIELQNRLNREKNELAATHREIETLFRNIDNIYYSIDVPHNRLLQISQACEKVLGYAVEDFQKSPSLCMDVIHPEDRVQVLKETVSLADGIAWSGQYRAITREGSVKWVETKLKPTIDGWGNLVRIDGITSDITGQKIAEEQLKQHDARLHAMSEESEARLINSEKRFRALVENGEGVAILRPDGYVLYASPSIEKILGYSDTEADNLNFFHFVHPEDIPTVEAAWRNVIAEPGVTHSGNACRVRRKDGEWRWIEVTLTNMIDEPAIGGIVDNFRDITEKLRANSELRMSEERYRYLFYNNPLPMWIFSRSTLKFLEVNEAAIEKYGYSREEFLRLTIKDIRPVAEVPRLMEIVRQWGNLHYVNCGTWTHQTKSGEYLYVEISSHFIQFEEEEAVLVLSNDITDKKKTQDRLAQQNLELIAIKTELEASENSLKQAQEIAHLGSWEADADASNAYWSDETYRILGIKRGEKEPSLDTFYSLIHSADIAAVKEVIDRARQASYVHAFNCRIVRATGEMRYVNVEWRYVPDQDGRKTRIQGIIHDRTENKISEAKLRHSEARLRQAQALASIGNWEVNFANNSSRWSDEAYRIYGIEPGDHQVTPEEWYSFVHPEDLEMVRSIIEQSKISFADFSFFHRIVRPDKSVRHVFSEGRYEFDPSGTPTGLYGIVHDVTEQRNNERQLGELNDQLRARAEELAASNADLERFAYVASHDLQEPLRMVSSFLQLLQKRYADKIDEAATQYITYAVEGADRMKRLILDLLEYSRVGTNRDPLADVNTAEVLQNVWHTFEEQIKEKQALVRWPDLPVIRAEKTQITQLFQNLVGNALKYNKSPIPEIEIGFRDLPEAWEFSVKDNGIGVEAKYFEKIFAIFQRLHTRTQYSGTGIGLAICKKIVEKHNGSIWVKSEPGKGSVFFFTIKK